MSSIDIVIKYTITHDSCDGQLSHDSTLIIDSDASEEENIEQIKRCIRVDREYLSLSDSFKIEEVSLCGFDNFDRSQIDKFIDIAEEFCHESN